MHIGSQTDRSSNERPDFGGGEAVVFRNVLGVLSNEIERAPGTYLFFSVPETIHFFSFDLNKIFAMFKRKKAFLLRLS